MSRAGLKRVSPRATGILLLAANAPDCDLVTAFGGSTVYLHYLPLLAVFPVLLIWLFSRWRKREFAWRRAYVVSLAGAAAHPLLDFTNIYGIRLLLPFSGEWLRADLINIVDLWIWLVLAIAAIAPALSRLVSSQIGANAGSGRGIAIFALSFLVLYASARWALHERAVAVLDSRLYSGRTPRRVAAFPSGPVNPFRWEGLIETDTFYGQFDVTCWENSIPT